jgi:hypothetical protein
MQSSNDCITGLKVNIGSAPLILLNVYMPTEYNDDDILEKYVDMCANFAIITDWDSPHTMIIGDFNCQPGTRFFDILRYLIDDNNLVLTDMSLMSADSNIFTYCSDSGANASSIDHVICITILI